MSERTYTRAEMRQAFASGAEWSDDGVLRESEAQAFDRLYPAPMRTPMAWNDGVMRPQRSHERAPYYTYSASVCDVRYEAEYPRGWWQS